MGEALSFANFGDLFVIFILEMILGFDNLLYISIESKRAPIGDQERVRKQGIIGAVILRIVLLAVTVYLLGYFTEPLFTINVASDPNTIHFLEGWISGSFTLTTLVFLVGGAFLMYTAVKEISHMLSVDDLEHEGSEKPSNATGIVIRILLMNIVFSFDSTLTAMAISDVFWVQASGIVLSGIAMYVLAEPFSAFLSKNRMYEVLGLFVLLIVGISLLGEGGHVAHMELFGYAVEPLAKSTFYFSIAVLFLVEIVQSRYQRKLDRKRAERNANH